MSHPAAPRTIRILIAMVALCEMAAGRAHAQGVTLVEQGSTMRYKANATNPGIGLTWTAEAFSDASWTAGSYGVGYDTAGPPNALALISSTVPSGTSSVYTRASFFIADPAQVSNLFVAADWDDGWIAWINGVEVYRSPQMPAGTPAWNTSAALHESSNAASPNYGALIDVSSAGIPALHAGTNLLAVGVWNNAPSSSDLVVVPKLVRDVPVAVTRGPYLQKGTPSSVVVRWRTATPVPGVVRYGPAPGQLTQQAAGPSTGEHVIELTGLQPSTRYFYSVGTPAQTLAGDDADHVFETPPPAGTPKRLRAWVIGDAGTNSADQRAVRDAWESWNGSAPTDLWLMLGDNAYQDGTDAEYQAAVFDIYPDLLKRSVVWPTLGNHDGHTADSATQTGPYYDMFTLPTAAEAGGIASGTEAYYAFDWANIHFVCLDSYETDRSPGSAMQQWLAQDLLATTRDWIIAFWHHPPYTKGSHDSDTEIELVDMRENFVPLLEDNGVDLVLTGHSHSYERSKFIDGHYGDSGTFSDAVHVTQAGNGRPGGGGAYTKTATGPVPHEGAVYTVAGSSGQTSGGPLNHPAMVVSLNELGSLVLDVDGNRLDATFLDDAGAVRDSFTLIKDPGRLPVAAFTASPVTGPAPLAVAFHDETINGPTGWAWDFQGDGTVDSSQRDPARVYAAPGSYTVSLTATNVAGSDVETKPFHICVTGATPPGPVGGLAFAADRQTLTWTPHALGRTYAVVKGNLGTLHTTGNFATALTGCLESGGTDTQAQDAATPAPGAGFWYLVAAEDCAGTTGSWNDGTESADRNPGIAAGPGCP